MALDADDREAVGFGLGGVERRDIGVGVARRASCGSTATQCSQRSPFRPHGASPADVVQPASGLTPSPSSSRKGDGGRAPAWAEADELFEISVCPPEWLPAIGRCSWIGWLACAITSRRGRLDEGRQTSPYPLTYQRFGRIMGLFVA